MQELNLNLLIKAARKQTVTEQGLETEDLAMWSTTDIYNAGIEDGVIWYARKLLAGMGVTWEETV